MGTALLHAGVVSLLASGALFSAPSRGAASTALVSDAEVRPLAGLTHVVDVGLDDYSVPVIRARSLADAAAVQGYLHARDRFVAMDLFRRLAAGELAEVLGPLALTHDQAQRVLQCRVAARAALEASPPEHRAILESYAAGVNAGLAALDAPPPEYRLLQLAPTPWQPEDSFLVYLWIAQMLADSARSELAIARFVELLPPEWVDFLRSPASRWTTTVVPDEAPVAIPTVPSVEVLDARGILVASGMSAVSDRSDEPVRAHAMRNSDDLRFGRATLEADEVPGSNGWVVRTPDGGAILANDMHLPLTVPFVWYRNSIVVERGGEGATDAPDVRLDGLSLPGVPAIVVGSNGSVAWGFTNVEGDFMDFVLVETDPDNDGRYRVPGGTEPFEEVEERIAVRGGEDRVLSIRRTRWGPITAEDAEGRPLALRWTALEPDGLNLALIDMADAETVADALDVAARWRGTQQNVTAADWHGSIGWTISGLLPRRVGFDGLVPVSWADGTRQWDGSWDGPTRPRVIDPPSGRIVTANQRTLPATEASRIGSVFAEPDRAARIDALLAEALASGELDERSLAAMQLDTRVERLVRWRDALLPALQRGAAERSADDRPTEQAARLTSIASIVAAWSGHADADEIAVAIIDRARRGLRLDLERTIVAAAVAVREPELTTAERAARVQRLGRLPAPDERFLELVEARTAHLLPPGDADWDAFIIRRTLEAAAQSRLPAGASPGGDPAEDPRADRAAASTERFQRWGLVNASDFGHPLASGLPVLAARFGIPTHEQSGHPAAVRVAGPRFGASNRLVVRPGREADALLQVPGGQSADPENRHYRDLHDSWRDGRPLPLQPVVRDRTLRFEPAETSTKTAPTGQPAGAP